jgi:hypothetical protein
MELNNFLSNISAENLVLPLKDDYRFACIAGNWSTENDDRLEGMN